MIHTKRTFPIVDNKDIFFLKVNLYPALDIQATMRYKSKDPFPTDEHILLIILRICPNKSSVPIHK